MLQRHYPKASTSTSSTSVTRPNSSQLEPGHLYTAVQRRLARLGFSDWSMFPLDLVQAGELWPIAHVIRFVFHQSVHATAHFLRTYSWFVVEKDDAALADALLKLMRLEFAYNASLSPVQFKKSGQFGEKKLTICSDFVSLIARTEAQLLTSDTAAKKPHIAEKSTISQQLQDRYAPNENTDTSCERMHRKVHCDKAILEKRSEIAEELRNLDLKRRALNRVLRQPLQSALPSDEF